MKQLLENVLNGEEMKRQCFEFVYNNWSPYVQTSLFEASEFCLELEISARHYEMLLEYISQLVTRFYYEGLNDGLQIGLNLEER